MESVRLTSLELEGFFCFQIVSRKSKWSDCRSQDIGWNLQKSERAVETCSDLSFSVSHGNFRPRHWIEVSQGTEVPGIGELAKHDTRRYFGSLAGLETTQGSYTPASWLTLIWQQFVLVPCIHPGRPYLSTFGVAMSSGWGYGEHSGDAFLATTWRPGKYSKPQKSLQVIYKNSNFWIEPE